MVCYATRPLPKWEFKDFLGWMEQGDGKLAYGIYVQNGRLKGDLKKALRMVIERYELPVRLTANQNLILCDIEEDWKADIISTLSGAGIKYVFSDATCTLCCMCCVSYRLYVAFQAQHVAYSLHIGMAACAHVYCNPHACCQHVR